MTIKMIPGWTVICDSCGDDQAGYTEYASFGPTPIDARDSLLFASDGVHVCGLDVCIDCQVTVICASCDEEDTGWLGNCSTCWERADRMASRANRRHSGPRHPLGIYGVAPVGATQ